MNFRNRTTFLVFSCTLFALTTFAAMAFAQSTSSPGGGVDDSNGVFQLEGNATNEATSPAGVCYAATGGPLGGPNLAPGYPSCPAGFTAIKLGNQTEDWSVIFAASTGSGTSLATAKSFVGDTINSGSDNIYTGGSTKDGLPLSGWLWKNGKPQGKDDIEHAYAAAYVRSSDGHTIVVAGADRYDNSGDSTMGFWFVQDPTVGSGVTTCGSGGGCAFGGTHTDGDLLIVSDFSTGGAISNITVYTWGNGTANLVGSIPGAQIGECNIMSGNNDLCGIVNPVNVTSPWGFTDKHLGATANFEPGEILEVGLDLNAIFNTAPCFTTFFAETRSSTSPTATLSDFTTPVSFPLCAIGVAKSCNGDGVVSADGSSVAYAWTVTVTNTGSASLYNPTVTDTYPDGTSQSILVPSSCGSTPNCLASKASATVPITFTATSSNVTNPLSVTNTADTYAFSQPNSGGSKIVPKPDVPQTSVCTAQVARGLSVTKHCDATNGGPELVSKGGYVVVDVPFTATVCNTGTEAVSGITLSDSPAANTLNIDKTSLAPNACANVTGDYFPTAVDSGSNGVIAGRYFFTDTLTASGTGVLDGKAVSGQGAVSCPICPDSECTNKPLP